MKEKQGRFRRMVDFLASWLGNLWDCLPMLPFIILGYALHRMGLWVVGGFMVGWKSSKVVNVKNKIES